MCPFRIPPRGTTGLLVCLRAAARCPDHPRTQAGYVEFPPGGIPACCRIFPRRAGLRFCARAVARCLLLSRPRAGCVEFPPGVITHAGGGLLPRVLHALAPPVGLLFTREYASLPLTLCPRWFSTPGSSHPLRGLLRLGPASLLPCCSGTPPTSCPHLVWLNLIPLASPSCTSWCIRWDRSLPLRT